ncbi:Auxin response factor 10 [Dichanthelium oligosanthes]|uniref:Auxin response factor n=1 Tax=Dichanthelium oligosanthes TaxID=888268 RepID=A0A1E5VQW1_9POAL|nr:Auxin response factor 10 [Dichanthelium oligosanthes]
MSAAACAPTRVGMLTFAADRMAPPPPLPAPAPVVEEVVIEGGGAAGGEGCVNAQLWLACAGSMCTVPPVGAAVYYFPQGHAEQASAAVDLPAAAAMRLPPFVACRVVAVRFMAEPLTDEVFAKIRLVPLRPGEPVADVGDAAAGGGGDDKQQHKPASFAKTLTQSDANNGGGFSVPRFCAETIFPELDYRAEPPVQSVYARDVHGVEWTFRHIYRGTPRRHLLTTGWSNFVNKKKLLAGDSIVFLRGENGRVHVGLRRAKRAFCVGGGGDEGAASLSGWGDTYGPLVRGNATGPGCGARSPSGKVPPEDVVAAARLAAAGQPFEVVHYPRASTPEFCVRAAAVRASMQVPWCPGMRFKMAFETEDSSRISWFMGTISGVKAADSACWPQSPWRLLQVTWDEPELLHNVMRVCPWLVEQVSSMPNLHLPNFAPSPSPHKKPRIQEFPFKGQPPLFDPAFPPAQPLPLAPHPHPHHDQNHHGGFIPFFPFPDGSAAAGIQGARHAQVAPFFSDLHISNLQQSLLLCGVRPADHHAPPAPRISTNLAIGNPPPRRDAPRSPSAGAKNADDVKPEGIMLFGRAILTEEQMKKNSSGVPTSPGATKNGSTKPDRDAEKSPNTPDGYGSGVTEGSPTKNNLWSEFGLEPGQCKVFAESDAVGRNLDLSALGSYEELCARLSAMFRVDDADLRSHVLYRTAAGEVKHVGDEPFR